MEGSLSASNILASITGKRLDIHIINISTNLELDTRHLPNASSEKSVHEWEYV